jgi:hypothetical protein
MMRRRTIVILPTLRSQTDPIVCKAAQINRICLPLYLLGARVSQSMGTLRMEVLDHHLLRMGERWLEAAPIRRQ